MDNTKKLFAAVEVFSATTRIVIINFFLVGTIVTAIMAKFLAILKQ